MFGLIQLICLPAMQVGNFPAAILLLGEGLTQWAKPQAKLNAECVQKSAIVMPRTEESQPAFLELVFLAEAGSLGLAPWGANEAGLRQVRTLC